MEFSIVANPIFIPIAFAANGIKNLIQKVRQVGQDPEDFTWNEGAPLITMTKIEDGGKAPKGQDVNGVLNALSEHVIYGQNGNRYTWSQDVVDEFGGYALGAIVQSNDTTKEFRSLVANNTVNPNNGLGGAWEVYSGQGSIPTATSTTAGITKVLNVLNSNDVGSALSAAQGKVLNDNMNNFLNKFSSSLIANNGSFSIPLGNGTTIIVKYGSASVNGDSNATVNFTTAFPSLCLNAQATLNNVAFDSQSDAGCGVTWTKTGLTLRNGTANTLNISWLAIGY
ncbi:tail fiber protein [Acinetobacter phage WCHABP12]|uniref:Putative tail fiber protein n=1 Tax=Acinetobacter phage WCHABP12 TaxID=1965454 RepID=A0A1V0DZ68_9CAUD|nr:tail fiber protein [Acinetobacter phage WCHABP12]ARB06756.1 putative tail fiber protein [Acinetobacter phage WCHABP12]